jgi:DNA-binding transcriptional ArsR family regulator/uncharacterized protein YndB with AHSA1/START domain
MARSELDPIWKALADPTRRGLLDLLKERPRTTGELCAALPHLSRFAVMKHLGVLEGAGLVLVRRRGRERWNHLNAVPIQAISERWIRPYEAEWAGSLLTVRRIAEAKQEENAMPTAVADGPITLRTMRIEQEVVIAAPPERVFDALTAEIGAWWTHSFRKPSLVRLEPRVGGRFHEEWGAGAGALYATVTRIARGEALSFAGPMGMTGAVQGVIHVTLAAEEAGTRLSLAHSAIGEIDEATAADYGRGWEHLLNGCLKPYVETGAIPEGMA